MKILVAGHKPYQVLKDGIYLPIQVGAGLPNRKAIEGFVPDNTGQNISELNPYYNELTALYWAKYNLADEDMIGLVHYRRYFGRKASHDLVDALTEQDIRKALENHDVILPRRRNYYIENQEKHYLNAHEHESFLVLRETIEEHYPAYLPAFKQMAASNKIHLFNMSVMKQADFQDYTDFIFGVLEKVRQRVNLDAYDDNNRRALGYLAERLMDVWVTTNKKSVCEFPLVTTERTNWGDKGLQFLIRKFLHRKTRTHF